MPDLVTHIAVAHLVRRRAWDQYDLCLFLTGTALPDLLTRPFYALFPKYFWAFHPLHTPCGLILACLLMSRFFEDSQRTRVFRLLLAGSALHCFLDLFQITVKEGAYSWLFPFSDVDFQVGLFWPEQSLVIAPFLVALCLIRDKDRAATWVKTLLQKARKNLFLL